MSKSSLIEAIEIESPCPKSWREMRGDDRVRYCEHCAFEVNNVSAMTRKEALRLVRRSSGRVCLRYETAPAGGRPIFATKLYRIGRQTGLAAGVLGASLALAAPAFAQNAPDAPVVQAASETPTDHSPARLFGYVTDPDGAAVPFALVTVYNERTGFYQSTNTSAEGFYEFVNLPAGAYRMKIEGGGFDVRETTVALNAENERREDARLAVPPVQAVVEVGGEIKVEKFVEVTVGMIVVSEPRSRMLQAVFNEDLEEIKVRVAMRERVNVKDKNHEGITPLHAAVELGNAEIAGFLLAHGAKANGRDFRRRTPLMMLDEDASPALVELLVRHGAKLDLVDKEGRTVLHHFAGDAEPEILRLLVAYGATVDAIDKQGRTPLMIAAENENVEAVKALLAAGARVDRRDKKGETAWSAAGEEIRRLLESYGAVAQN